MLEIIDSNAQFPAAELGDPGHTFIPCLAALEIAPLSIILVMIVKSLAMTGSAHHNTLSCVLLLIL